MTSARPPTRSASTWATCGARPRSAGSRGCCTRCAASATCCARPMSFRRRITLVSAAAVAIAVVLASLLTYLLTSHQLHSQVDAQLRNRSRGAPAVHRAPEPVRRAVHRDSGRLGAASEQAGATDQGATPPGRPRTTSGHARTQPGTILPPPTRPKVRGYQQLIDAQGRMLFRSARDVYAAGRRHHARARRERRASAVAQRARRWHPSARAGRAVRRRPCRAVRPAAHRSRPPAEPPAPDPRCCSTSAASRSRRCSGGWWPAPPCCRSSASPRRPST